MKKAKVFEVVRPRTTENKVQKKQPTFLKTQKMEQTIKQQLKHSLLKKIWQNNNSLNELKIQKKELHKKRTVLKNQLSKLKYINL